MAYSDAIAYLYGLQGQGIKLGLEKTAALLQLVGNPQLTFRSVHVAGTNGKGSVSAMTASILASAGICTGLFTSPHLVSFTERIRIDDRCISEEEVVGLTDEIRERISAAGLPLPTFFEFVTAIAFLHFSRNGVEWAVVETGLGGRLDSTNVVIPAVSVITPIGMDHQEFLGESLAAIAFEKAGIIKPGVPVVSASQLPEAGSVIAAACADQSAPLYCFDRDFSSALLVTGIEGTQFDYRDNDLQMTDLFVPLSGAHQAENSALAVRASLIALSAAGIGKDAAVSAVDAGLERVRWRGRLELVSTDPDIIVDGAHNPAAAETLAAFLRMEYPARAIILVLGIMADKDYRGILSALLPVASLTIFTAPACSRSAAPEELASAASAAGFERVRSSATVRDALSEARDACEEAAPTGHPLIVVTGSFYTAGEALEALGEQTSLGRLREWA